MTLQLLDPWDPNNWPALNPPHEFRIYGDDRAETYALVDEEDYSWAVKWHWFITKRCTRNRRKEYMRRTASRWSNGVRVGVNSFYLHVEIMKRTGIVPPSPLHTIVDHRHGDGLDCRRANLRWATSHMNSKNVRGSHAQDHHFENGASK